eukprot:16118865-Heterocapsa_arctica.AAC.1
MADPSTKGSCPRSGGRTPHRGSPTPGLWPEPSAAKSANCSKARSDPPAEAGRRHSGQAEGCSP